MVCNSRTAQRLKPLRVMSDPGSHRFTTGNMSLEMCHRKRATDPSRWKRATGNINLFMHAKTGIFFYRTQLDTVQLDGTPLQPTAHPQ
jgi:hypothetical protein